jgi:hypothetical protein
MAVMKYAYVFNRDALGAVQFGTQIHQVGFFIDFFFDISGDNRGNHIF